MDDLKNPISSISFKGFMRATVIKRDDEKLEGRIGVNIHKLMPDEDHTNLNEKESIETPKQQTNFFSSESEVKPIENEQIISKNFYWARPSFRFSNNKGKTSGNYLVPQIGELVVVYFEDNDPQKCRYLPFDIVKDGEKLLELEKYFNKDILKDPKKKPNIEILTKTPNGNIIGFDYNEDTNSFLVGFDKGDLIQVTNNADKDEILLKTADGAYVKLDGKNHYVEVSTKDSKVKIDGENNSIEAKTKDTVAKLDGNSNKITTTSAKTDINSDSEVKINSPNTSVSGTSEFLGSVAAKAGLAILGSGTLNGKNILVDGNSGGSGGGSGGNEVDLSQYLIKNTEITSATKTKITYDSKGLVLSGSNATTEDILETANKKFISDTQLQSLETLINGNNINSFYPHTQIISSDTWNIVHNLNGSVSVDVYNELGVKVISSYTVIDNNTLTIDLLVPMIGYAYIYKKTTGFYKFIKLAPSNVWDIPHNLEGTVTVEVFNSLGNRVMVNYEVIDTNNIRVNLISPMSGYSYISKID